VDAALALAETREEMLEEMKQYTYSHNGTDKRGRFSRIGYPGKGLFPTPGAEAGKPDDTTRTKNPWNDKMQAIKA
jgi:hypothetical protein